MNYSVKIKTWVDEYMLRGWRPLVWIAAAGFLLYAQTLVFDFTYLDDNVLILDNQLFLSNASNIFAAFRQEVFHVLHHSAAYYRPLLTVSFIIDAQLGGTSPLFYHLTNILLHLGSACLLFVLLGKLGHSRMLAFAFSLVFTAHPVFTQAVAWVPGRNDSLLALFVLAAFIFFLKFLETKKWSAYAWHLAFFSAALFTKESALVLVVLLSFFLFWIKKEKPLSRTAGILAAGWAGSGILWFGLRQTAFINPMPMTLGNMIQSLFNNLPALVQFIGKITFPFNLSVLPLIQDTTFVYGIASLLILAGAFIVFRARRYGFVAFGLLWFLAFLLPSFIRPNPSVVADFIEHRVYVPMIGFLIALLEFGAVRKVFKKEIVLIFSSAAMVILFSILTLLHSGNFRNRTSFWENAVEHSPHSPLAQRNLGAMYYLDGKLKEAEPLYRRALELNPTEEMAHNNLGIIYMDWEQLDRAEEEFKKELEINPSYDKAHFNLGLLYYKQGKNNEAVEMWKKTLAINPDFLDAYKQLAKYFADENDFEQARLYTRALIQHGGRVSPEFIRAIGLYLF